jgi:hypothetical protein
VPTVTVAVPVAVVLANATVALPAVQVGKSVAPDGLDVSAHVMVTFPA